MCHGERKGTRARERESCEWQAPLITHIDVCVRERERSRDREQVREGETLFWAWRCASQRCVGIYLDLPFLGLLPRLSGLNLCCSLCCLCFLLLRSTKPVHIYMYRQIQCTTRCCRVCIYIHVHMHIHTYQNTHIHTYAYTYMCKHTHTHTQNTGWIAGNNRWERAKNCLLGTDSRG